MLRARLTPLQKGRSEERNANANTVVNERSTVTTFSNGDISGNLGVSQPSTGPSTSGSSSRYAPMTNPTLPIERSNAPISTSTSLHAVANLPANISPGNLSTQDGVIAQESPRTPIHQRNTANSLTPATAERRTLVPLLLDKLKAELSESDEDDDLVSQQPVAKRARLDLIPNVESFAVSNRGNVANNSISRSMPLHAALSKTTQSDDLQGPQSSSSSSTAPANTSIINAVVPSSSASSMVLGSTNSHASGTTSQAVGQNASASSNIGNIGPIALAQSTPIVNGEASAPISHDRAVNGVGNTSEKPKRRKSADSSLHGAASSSSTDTQPNHSVKTFAPEDASPTKKRRRIMEVEIIPLAYRSPKGKGAFVSKHSGKCLICA